MNDTTWSLNGREYRLQEKLADKGSTQLWRAVTDNGQPVVLKAADLNEATACALLANERHFDGLTPRLPFCGLPLLASGRNQDHNILVLPDYWGDLQRWSQEVKPGAKPLLELMKHMLHSLNALHSKGYAHADVTPGNWLFKTPRTLPAIIDLALARPLNSGSDLGQTAYPAPEQKTLDTPTATAAADCYGVGRCLYYCICNAELDANADPQAISTAIRDGLLKREQPSDDPQATRLPPDAATAHAIASLDKAMQALLSEDPDRRCDFVASLLESNIEPEPAAQVKQGNATPSALPQSPSTSQSKPKKTITAAAMVCGLSIAALALWTQQPRETQHNMPIYGGEARVPLRPTPVTAAQKIQPLLAPLAHEPEATPFVVSQNITDPAFTPIVLPKTQAQPEDNSKTLGENQIAERHFALGQKIGSTRPLRLKPKNTSVKVSKQSQISAATPVDLPRINQATPSNNQIPTSHAEKPPVLKSASKPSATTQSKATSIKAPKAPPQHGKLIQLADFAAWCTDHSEHCTGQSLADGPTLNGATPRAVRAYLQSLSQNGKLTVRLANAKELQSRRFTAAGREWVTECPTKNGIARCDYASYYHPVSRRLVHVRHDSALDNVVFRIVVELNKK